jgi:hypothetical protein
MLVVSQQRMSEVLKDVSISDEEKYFYLLQLSILLELRYVSMRSD